MQRFFFPSHVRPGQRQIRTKCAYGTVRFVKYVQIVHTVPYASLHTYKLCIRCPTLRYIRTNCAYHVVRFVKYVQIAHTALYNSLETQREHVECVKHSEIRETRGAG
jgi:hypothetical protein